MKAVTRPKERQRSEMGSGTVFVPPKSLNSILSGDAPDNGSQVKITTKNRVTELVHYVFDSLR